MDRISELPECIIHHILSFLDSPLDFVRISALSRKWFALSASFPILDFMEDEFVSSVGAIPEFPLASTEKYKFLNYIAYRMSIFSVCEVSSHTFKLYMWIGGSEEQHLVDGWIGLVVEKDVQVFEVILCPTLDENRYRLPNTLLSASSLTIYHCHLPSSLMVGGVKFKSLKVLSLGDVYIDEEMFKYLTTSCPLLEEIDFQECKGFKRLCVSGLQNLKIVTISGVYEVESVDIEAPNLKCFDFNNCNERNTPFINLVSCKKLKTLSFYSASIVMTKWLTEFLSNFPLLEKVHLTLPIHEKAINADELKVINSLPYEVEQVGLRMQIMPQVSSVYPALVAVVDAVLRCWHPQYLTIRFNFQLIDFKERCNFLKYICEKLLHQKDECLVEIVLRCRSKAKKHFFNLNLLLDTLPDTLPSNWSGSKMTFITKKLANSGSRQSSKHC